MILFDSITFIKENYIVHNLDFLIIFCLCQTLIFNLVIILFFFEISTSQHALSSLEYHIISIT